MQVIENADLAKYTTLKTKATAKYMFFPETLDETVALLKDNPYIRIIGRGSNLLINNESFDAVCSLKEIKQIDFDSEGHIYCEAGASIQSLIDFANNNERGGVEYLYSLPATVGGCIFMNAGNGHNIDKSISKYIVDVTVCKDGQLLVFSREECMFNDRASIFQENNYCIVSARFSFLPSKKQQTDIIKRERLTFVKANHDLKCPNAGSVFKNANGKIMELLMKTGFGWKNGMHYSTKTTNWILNEGNGTFKQAMFLIGFTKLLHFAIGKKVALEWSVWRK